MAAGAQGIKAGRAYVEIGTYSKVAAGLRRAQRRLKAFGSTVGAIGAKMMRMGALAMAPLLLSGKAFASMGDNIAKMAKRTGLSVAALSELRYVATQTGTELGAFEKSIRRMQVTIFDAGRGLSTAVDGLAALGLTYKDLKELSPEGQLKLMAEQLSKVEHASEKAAIASMVFGRSGTALLPMMAAGAKGIDDLQKKARRLGLTMSAEDAAAAEEFTDAMDSASHASKMMAFHVGAALAPVLQDLADNIASAAKWTADWIRRNRMLFVTILKITGAVLASGVALVALSLVIKLITFAISGLLVILALAKAAFVAFGAVLTFLLTPLGLVILTIGLLGTYILTATKAGAKALGWLGDKFGKLETDVRRAWAGIGDAIASGDIGLAVQIMWLTIKKAWQDGTKDLRQAWTDYMMFFKLSWLEGSRFIARSWIALTGVLKKIWSEFSGWWQKAQEGLATELTYYVARLGGATVQQAKDAAKHARETHNARLQQIDDETKRRQQAHNAEFNALDKLIDKNHAKMLEGIISEHRKSSVMTEAELKKVRAEWKKAISEAVKKREKMLEEDAGPGRLEGPQALLDKIKALAADLAYNTKAAEKVTVGVTGTFSARALWGMGGGRAAERTAKATEETAKNTKKINRDQKRGGRKFD